MAGELESPKRRYGLTSQFIDLFVSPSTFFSTLDSQPTWGAVLILGALLSGLSSWALWTSDTGLTIRDNARATVVELARSRMTSQQFAQYLDYSARRQYSTGRLVSQRISGAIAGPVVLAVFVQGALNILLLAAVPYRVVLRVLSYASVIWVVENLFLDFLTYLAHSPRLAATLPQLMPVSVWPSEGTVWRTMVDSFDVFMPWWMTIVSIGLAKAYVIRSAYLTTSLSVCYGAWILIQAAATWLFRNSAGNTPFQHPF